MLIYTFPVLDQKYLLGRGGGGGDKLGLKNQNFSIKDEVWHLDYFKYHEIHV